MEYSDLLPVGDHSAIDGFSDWPLTKAGRGLGEIRSGNGETRNDHTRCPASHGQLPGADTRTMALGAINNRGSDK